MTYSYVAYTLNITSEIVFPELLESEDKPDSDVVIRWGKVCAEGIANATSRGLTYQISHDVFWLYVPNVAYFLVQGGCEIIVDPLPQSDEDSIRAFLLEACFGVLLMQRTIFLIRGCVIQIEDYAVAFVGDYGLGQSTLLLDFIRSGYPILADNICAIDSLGQVWPSFPQIHLWPHAMAHWGDDLPSTWVLRPGLEKVYASTRQSFHPKRLPLRAIYNLSINNLQINRFTPLYSIQKIQCLEKNIYKKYLVDELGIKSKYFKQSFAIAQRVIMADLERSVGAFRVVQWIDLVKEDLKERSVDYVPG